jgi:hypothetical protein
LISFQLPLISSLVLMWEVSDWSGDLAVK